MFVRHYYASCDQIKSVVNLNFIQKFRANQRSDRILNPKLIPWSGSQPCELK
jgi:hypothetical protein